MPQPTTNNLEGWEISFRDKFVKDLGDKCEPVFLDPNGSVGPIIRFIKDLRKHDMEELMNKFTNDLGLELNGREIKQLIKDYYN